MQEKYTSKLFVTKKNDKFLKIMKIYQRRIGKCNVERSIS